MRSLPSRPTTPSLGLMTAALLAAVVCSACSIIVSPDPEQRCEFIGGAPPCPGDLVCILQDGEDDIGICAVSELKNCVVGRSECEAGFSCVPARPNHRIGTCGIQACDNDAASPIPECPGSLQCLIEPGETVGTCGSQQCDNDRLTDLPGCDGAFECIIEPGEATGVCGLAGIPCVPNNPRCPEGEVCVQESEGTPEFAGRFVCAPRTSEEVCGNGVDEDGDGQVDEGVPDVCDGRDNDCDGRTDENSDGIENDEDNDGITFCGESSDCDDSDIDVHPAGVDASGAAVEAAEEICDGKDNDCDTEMDEGVVCPAGTVCAPSIQVGECVALHCGRDESSCPAGMEDLCRCGANEACNTNLDPPACVEITEPCSMSCDAGFRLDLLACECQPLAPLGTVCERDEDCLENLRCFTAAAFPRATVAGEKFCGVACCSDADCDGDDVCWASSTSARSCMPREMVGVPAPGTLTSGAVCQMDSQCRSGMCAGDLEGCVTSCTSDDQCTPPTVCGQTISFTRLGEPEVRQLSCIRPWGGSDESCRAGDTRSCPNALCDFSTLECSKPCGSDSDCAAGRRCAVVSLSDGGNISMCRDIDEDVVATATRGSGEACESADDCRSGLCINNRCISYCCGTSDCPSGMSCVPFMAGSTATMTCVPD